MGRVKGNGEGKRGGALRWGEGGNSVQYVATVYEVNMIVAVQLCRHYISDSESKT